MCFASSPVTLGEELLQLGAVQALSLLLAHPGEEEATVDMGLKALYVLLESGGERSAEGAGGTKELISCC